MNKYLVSYFGLILVVFVTVLYIVPLMTIYAFLGFVVASVGLICFGL